MRIGRLRVKQGQRANLSITKKQKKNIEEYISKLDQVYWKKGQFSKKYTWTCKKKKDIFWNRIKENSKNAESFTKWI